MNTKTLKGMIAAASLLIGIGAASPALADSSTGVQSLGVAANAIDQWTFSCRIGARARVFDLAPPFNGPARMQVWLTRDGAPTALRTDVLPLFTGEGGAPSGYAVVIDGAGVYTMRFQKTAPGVEAYVGQAACVNALGGFMFNPVLTKTINQ